MQETARESPRSMNHTSNCRCSHRQHQTAHGRTSLTGHAASVPPPLIGTENEPLCVYSGLLCSAPPPRCRWSIPPQCVGDGARPLHRRRRCTRDGNGSPLIEHPGTGGEHRRRVLCRRRHRCLRLRVFNNHIYICTENISPSLRLQHNIPRELARHLTHSLRSLQSHPHPLARLLGSQRHRRQKAQRLGSWPEGP